MNYREASEEGGAFNCSYRAVELGTGKLEVYDRETDSFFYAKMAVTTVDNIDRKPGRGSKTKDDWAPGTKWLRDSIDKWVAFKEERKPGVIEETWENALLKSPVTRCWRLTAKGETMVRDGDKNTWVTSDEGMKFKKIIGGVFRNYDGWQPMEADHDLATIKLDGGAHFYNLELWKAELRRNGEDPVIVEGTFSVPVSNLGKPRSAKVEPRNPNAPPAAVNPLMITAAIELGKSIAAALPNIKHVDDNRAAVAALIDLTKKVTWNLREDRNKWS